MTLQTTDSPPDNPADTTPGKIALLHTYWITPITDWPAQKDPSWRRASDVAACIRHAIKTARARGELTVPDGAKISVTSDNYSGGASVDVRVSNVPRDYAGGDDATKLARLADYAAGDWHRDPHDRSHHVAVEAATATGYAYIRSSRELRRNDPRPPGAPRPAGQPALTMAEVRCGDLVRVDGDPRDWEVIEAALQDAIRLHTPEAMARAEFWSVPYPWKSHARTLPDGSTVATVSLRDITGRAEPAPAGLIQEGTPAMPDPTPEAAPPAEPTDADVIDHYSRQWRAYASLVSRGGEGPALAGASHDRRLYWRHEDDLTPCHHPTQTPGSACPPDREITQWGECRSEGCRPVTAVRLDTAEQAVAYVLAHPGGADRADLADRSRWLTEQPPARLEADRWVAARRWLVRRGAREVQARAEALAAAAGDGAAGEAEVADLAAVYAAEVTGEVTGFITALALLRGIPDDRELGLLWALRGYCPMTPPARLWRELDGLETSLTAAADLDGDGAADAR